MRRGRLGATSAANLGANLAMMTVTFAPGCTFASAFSGPRDGPVPIEFLLFAAVLAGVVLFPARNLSISVAGVLLLAAYKIVASPFAAGPGVRGLVGHLRGECADIHTQLFSGTFGDG